MKLQQKLLSVLVAAGLSAALGSAHASTFSFDPDGAGAGAAISGASIFDQAAGSTLAVGGAGGGTALAVGTQLTNLYQANLSAVQAGNTANLFANGTNGLFFTFVATFTEVVTSSTVVLVDNTQPFDPVTNPALFAQNTFSVIGGTFKMCAQSALGDNLAGTGFSCAGNGILSGSISSGSASTAAFFTQGLGTLDQGGGNGDQWGGTQTIATTGAANLNATINFADANYFPDLPVGISFVMAAVNSSLITPFNQVDPSLQFSSDTIANGDVAANVGPINGITGPNFIFQSDANASIVIPEPASLAIVGLGLAALGLTSRRRKA